jgi:glycine C-acetyltransferase
LNFCANNYLGLSNNSRLIDAAKKTLDTHGFGMSSVRFICGTQDIHKNLEKVIADYYSVDDCILFPSGFDANAGFFEAIFGPEDLVVSDSLNHASIIDGIRLCKAKKERYDHLDMKSLEEKLSLHPNARMKVIVTDGVFSMDGDIAPLDKIYEIAQKHNAYIYVD